MIFFFYLIFYIQDWLDIDFGIAEGVDFIAISFVKSAEVITHLKSYIAARSRDRYVTRTLYCLRVSSYDCYY
jgi:hypothetical protein